MLGKKRTWLSSSKRFVKVVSGQAYSRIAQAAIFPIHQSQAAVGPANDVGKACIGPAKTKW